jgi:luciferase family oxidoreductase group 1
MAVKQSRPIPVSILDWVLIRGDETAADALKQTAEFAQHVEALGYRRFWIPEHHGVAMTASAATPLVMAHVASNTSTIRVGSGGIMLPNHAPLIVAEQFGTLASLYPGRIDLGLGRASGDRTGDDELARALHLSPEARQRYPSDLIELQSYFHAPQEGQKLVAAPGAGIDMPIWILGSSDFSAAQAGALGMPFAFATYVGHKMLDKAVAAYRSSFTPSVAQGRPYLMISAIVVAAENDDVARDLFTSIQQVSVGRTRGKNMLLPPPAHDFMTSLNSEERARLDQALPFAIVGSRETVRHQIEDLVSATKADELMILSFIYDQAARRRCAEIIADICR